jgi:hypothetical protein
LGTLRRAAHHLAVVLLLLELVVEGLELLRLVSVPVAGVTREDVLDILSERHFRTEAIHQLVRSVVVAVGGGPSQIL